MNGLTLVGSPIPVSVESFVRAIPDRVRSLPSLYLELMTTWGAGLLCGAFDLPSPAEPRFQLLQDRFFVHGPVLRASGHWAQITEEIAKRVTILGTDRRGFAVASDGSPNVLLLHPRGHVLPIGPFETLIQFLLDGRLARTRSVIFETAAEGHWWKTERFDTSPPALGVPAIHVTVLPPARAEILDALSIGDEARADAALVVVLESEIALYALLDLTLLLAGCDGNATAPDLRARFAEQLFKMAVRRAPWLEEEISIREIRERIVNGEDVPEGLLHTLRANSVLEPPDGIFVDDAEEIERKLVRSLAVAPGDGEARERYAEHLAVKGRLAQAAALRAAPKVAASVPDAAARGFVPLSGAPPVNGATQTTAHVDRWRAADPTIALDGLLAHIDALHPAVKQGYALLVSHLDDLSFVRSMYDTNARLHLQREMKDG